MGFCHPQESLEKNQLKTMGFSRLVRYIQLSLFHHGLTNLVDVLDVTLTKGDLPQLPEHKMPKNKFHPGAFGEKNLIVVNLQIVFYGTFFVSTTPLKINMEHNHGGLEDHFPF